MELREIAGCIAAIETALLSGFAERIDFSSGEMICRVVRSNVGIRYYFQTLVQHQVESAEELAGIAYRAQNGTPALGRSRSTATPIRFPDRFSDL